jgi:hypothetical protein
MWKMRLFALVIIVVSVGLIYFNWQQLIAESTYSIRLAAFAPLGVVAGLFLLIFPDKGGRPETTMEKITAMLVFFIGIAAGLYNWYLMDPGYFSFLGI